MAKDDTKKVRFQINGSVELGGETDLEAATAHIKRMVEVGRELPQATVVVAVSIPRLTNIAF